jgi:PAS domain-containing protein
MISRNNSSNLLQSLAPSLRERLESLAQAEGTSTDQLLVLAIAEKLARTEHAAWLAQRAWMETAVSDRGTIRERLQRRDAESLAGDHPGSSSGADDPTAPLPDAASLQILHTGEERERAKLAELFDGAPVFIAVLSGPEHVFEMVNQSYRELLGNRELIGRRVVDCVPEVAGTVWIDLLDHVYRTGEPRFDRGARLSLAPAAGAPLEDKYVDYAYKPRREADGTISGIIAIGVDTSLVQEVLQSTGGASFLLGDK